MTDNEKELMKVGAETALKPFANLIERLFGGAVDQIGGGWEDRLKVRRQIRQLGLLKRLQGHIDELGFEPQPIPDKIWLPAVQAALLEDDEGLQEKWATLLANAADPAQAGNIWPAFTGILAELSPRAASFLDAMYAKAEGKLGGRVFSQQRQIGSSANRVADSPSDREYGEDELLNIYVDAGLARSPKLTMLTFGDLEKYGTEVESDWQDFRMTIDTLRRSHLVVEVVRGVQSELSESSTERVLQTYSISELGVAFVRACRRP